MSRACTVCTHPDRWEIDHALVLRQAYRAISCQFEVGRESLRRHAQEHLPETLARAYEAEEATRADDLLTQLKTVANNLERLSRKAEEDEDYRTAIGGNVALLKYAELLAKVRQLIDDSPKVNILIAPQAQDVIIQALVPYPEARLAVSSALKELEEGT